MSKKKQRKPGISAQAAQTTAPENGEPRVRSVKTGAGKTAPVAPAKRVWWIELAFVLPAAVLGAVLFFNAVNGEFVYDDQRQIVRNSLIQDSSQTWRALTSDVWAFKGSGIAASNYWRPTFVAWMIANFRLFGVEQARPWHITNIILNVAVIVLAFFLLRRFGLSPPVAAAIAIIFAAHPAHTESVAWISGSPDLLMALALLGSLWFVLSIREKNSREKWLWAMLLYIVALGAKEVAIFFPVVVFAVFWRPAAATETRGRSAPDAVMQCAPFVVLAIIYFAVRIGVLGQFAEPPLDAPGAGSTLLSLPAVFTFYLRQIVFPYWVGPSYPLRPVTLQTIGLFNFVLPLLVTIAAGILMFWLARRSLVQRVGFALFLITLVPAMNISSFVPEQIVHDRYLYLPLLGFLMLTIPELALLAGRFRNSKTVQSDTGQVHAYVTSNAEWAILVLAAIAAIPLGWQTVRNNRAWVSNLALWTRSIEADPKSSLNYLQYGAELLELKRYDEALVAYDRSIAISPNPQALIGRGRGRLSKRMFAEAEADFQSVIALPNDRVALYSLYQGYEGLTITFDQQNKLDEALSALKKGRDRLTPYQAALTEKIAVVMRKQGHGKEAAAELERFRNQAETETLPESKMVILRLGQLYNELGRSEEARTALQRYLTITQGLQDPQTQEARKQASKALQQLSKK